MRAVILAGGKGTRLRPYTTIIPKPLVPIGEEMPILEFLLMQLKHSGVSHVTITVNHMANLIMAFFGDGSKWGLRIDYSIENEPLSTIGPLTLIDDLPENFLVMNGDLLTDIDFRKFFDAHLKYGSALTIASYMREQKVDFGVIDCDNEGKAIGFREKPVYRFKVSMGIYAMSRNIISGLKKGKPYGFDNLMIDGIKDGMDIKVYPFDGYWLDIGRPDDYERANQEFPEIRNKIFGR